MSTGKNKPTARVGIFGGSFNPPHTSHVLVALFALSTWDLDEVLVIPSYRHALDKELVSFEHRFRMAELAFRPLGPRVQVSRIEEELGDVSYTVNTVRELQRRHPGAQFYLVIGSDILGETAKWREYDELVRLAPPLVVPRLGVQTHSGSRDALGFFLPAISSTDLRATLAGGHDPGMAIPPTVQRYIAEHGLYGQART